MNLDELEKQKDLLLLGLLEEKRKTARLVKTLQIAQAALHTCGCEETFCDDHTTYMYDKQEVKEAIRAIRKLGKYWA